MIVSAYFRTIKIFCLVINSKLNKQINKYKLAHPSQILITVMHK